VPLCDPVWAPSAASHGSRMVGSALRESIPHCLRYVSICRLLVRHQDVLLARLQGSSSFAGETLSSARIKTTNFRFRCFWGLAGVFEVLSSTMDMIHIAIHSRSQLEQESSDRIHSWSLLSTEGLSLSKSQYLSLVNDSARGVKRRTVVPPRCCMLYARIVCRPINAEE
jgi:hypothetical protein